MTTDPTNPSKLFFGLILVSVHLVGKEIQRRNLSRLVSFCLGIGFAYWITVAAPVQWGSSSLSLFFAGAIVICAMILPGISGSLILLTMGLYQPIIGAVSDRDLGTIAVFALGALCGLAAFIKVLNFLLDHHRAPTLMAMAGFMLGSLRALWPWGADQDASSGIIIGMFILGALIVSAFIFIDLKKARAINERTAQK